ncbi:MAG: glycosyltransferase family 2 protein [Chitinophagaceae bacterium]
MSVLVSILIPAHHSALTIRASLESCLAQTHTHLEILVLNSISGDHTAEVIQDINDPRIALHETSENKGIAAARNQLLKLAKGEFIAWLDADDVMMPERIERQLAYFKAHPETDIAGTWIRTDHVEVPEKRLPTHHQQIYHCLWFKNCIIQPSVMSRNFYVQEGIFYDEEFANTAEDYELWYRLRDRKHFANIPEYLTLYHMTTGEELERKKKAGRFNENLSALWQKKWQAVSTEISEPQKLSFINFLYRNDCPDTDTLNGIRRVLSVLNEENKDPFFQLILSYHHLRLWRNMKLVDKMRHVYALRHLMKWSAFKKYHLI